MKTQMTLLILVGLLFNFGGAQAQDHHMQASHYQSKPIVKMTLNGKKIWALLDTGTEMTILDVNVSDQYDFKTYINTNSKYVVPGVGANNFYQMHQVRNVELKYGDTKLDRKVYAYNLANVVGSIRERTGKKITAIIGSDMMSAYGFVINLGDKTVVLQNKDNHLFGGATARSK